MIDLKPMTVEKRIEKAETIPAGGQRVASGRTKMEALLRDLEPFFCRRPLVYVDVGAHRGDIFTEICRSSLKLQEAHLIEPNPVSFVALERAVEAEGVRIASCHRLALSDRPASLRLRDADTMTKVIDRTGKGAEADARMFEVEARTLDDLAQGFITPHISLLKIDVEGHEAEVLAGARRLLEAQAIDIIYIEVGLDPDGTQQTYYRAIEDLLRPYRYRLFRIYEQMNEWLEDSPLLRRANFAFMSATFAQRNPYRLSRELLALRKEKETLKASLTARFAELAKLAKILESERAAAEHAAVAHDRKLQAVEAELARAQAAAGKAEAELTKAQAAQGKAEAAAAEARAAQRKAEAALGKADAAHRAMKTELAAARAGRQKAEAELSKLLAYARTMEKKYMALVGSTTWRMMEPVRRILRLVKGKKPPKPFEPHLLPADGARRSARPDPAPASASFPGSPA